MTECRPSAARLTLGSILPGGDDVPVKPTIQAQTHMKKAPILLSATATLLVTAVLFAAERPAKDMDSHLGTWQRVSGKYGDAKEFSDVPKDDRHIKIITPTHFIWVMYDAKTNLISASMGGSCHREGASYTETIEYYFPEPLKEYLNKKQEFTIKVEGDKLIQLGKLSDGQKLEEVWQRVK